MKPEHHDLIQDYLHGRLLPEQIAPLNALLREDAEAREWLRGEAAIETRLCELATTGTLAMPHATEADFRHRDRWPRLIAPIAAGILVGGLAVSAVWAYAAPKLPPVKEVPLADGDFETGAPIPNASVPQRSGEWSGDPCAIVEAQGRVHPREGRHMLKFLAASTTGDFAGSKNMAADLWQVIALPGSGARTVRIRAWFNADTDKQARFHIAAVAGDDANADPKALWEQRYSEGGSLAFARSMTFVDRDPATWEAGELTLQVPPQARVLVIGIAAYRLPVVAATEWFPAQFVDDVSVTISEEVLP